MLAPLPKPNERSAQSSTQYLPQQLCVISSTEKSFVSRLGPFPGRQESLRANSVNEGDKLFSGGICTVCNKVTPPTQVATIFKLTKLQKCDETNRCGRDQLSSLSRRWSSPDKGPLIRPHKHTQREIQKHIHTVADNCGRYDVA